MKPDAATVVSCLLGLTAVVAAAFVGLGDVGGSVVLAAVGVLLVGFGIWLGWPEPVVGDGNDNVG